jgi:NAD(P)-dependent dehydrogenase (short-subunit alcohol dehydrogenase family)
VVSALAAEGWSVVAVDRCAPDRRLPYAMATERDLDAAIAAASERAGRDDVARAVVADAADPDALRPVIEGAEACSTDTPLLAQSARLFELPSPRDFAPRHGGLTI